MKKDLSYWLDKSKRLTYQTTAYINGVYSNTTETFASISPIDERHLGDISHCNEVDVDRAVNIARVAFNQGGWRNKSPQERKICLLAFADLIEANKEDLALLETLDMGKPINDALTIDLPSIIRTIRWCAEAIDKIYGEVAPTNNDEIGLITKEPIGVVAAITPWNFPLIMAAWKFAPALAAGNAVLLKPSEKSPLTAIQLGALAEKAGIPKGIFQVLPGLGHTTGNALALHEEVDVITFTGSTETAKQLFIASANSNMKRVYVETGGKSPHLVFADSEQLDEAAKAAASAICFNQGEVCTAGSRLLIEDSIADEFIKKVEKHIQNWQPAHPLDPKSTQGAIVDASQLKQIQNHIKQAKEDGAIHIVGGDTIKIGDNGFLSPAVFDHVDNQSNLAQQEIFGPVLAIIRFKTEQQAIALANESIYGLAAGIWTENLNKAHRVAKKLQAGSVWINHYDGGDMTAPFGGYKQSGNGRDKSFYAFDKYIQIKSTWLKLKDA